MIKALWLLLAAVWFNTLSRPAYALDDLVLLVQPTLGEDHAKRELRPLCDYLGALIGRPCRLLAPASFVAYWGVLRRGEYDLALDAAHFTDYRIRKMGFSVLAKMPDSISYSLVVTAAQRGTDPAELVGRRVATLGPLSIGAARLDALYPNPVRQPVVIEVDSVEQGIDLLRRKQVAAAILPTPVVTQQLARGDLAVVLTTEPTPHMALSASPRLAPEVQEKIRSGILNADRSAAGKKMLQEIGVERFDPTTAEAYANHGNVLKSYWGY